jgi:transaldolase
VGGLREEKAIASKLDQLRSMTTLVADTGDLGVVTRLKPVDCTTNPTIVLKAVDTPDYRDVVDEALTWGRRQRGDVARVAAATADRLAISVVRGPDGLRGGLRDPAARAQGEPTG